MSNPVDSPAFWKQRLIEHDLRRAIWLEDDGRWDKLEAKNREELAVAIYAHASVLDAGCGTGRLLDLMPEWWVGDYLGIDISPDLLAKAEELHPGEFFMRADLRDLSLFKDKSFDMAVVCMVRHMIVTHLGQTEWDKMEKELNRVARRLLILEPQEVSEGYK